MAAFRRFVALGDSTTEGLEDPYPGGNTYRGWADRLAARLAAVDPDVRYANLAVRGRKLAQIRAEQLGPALAMEPDILLYDEPTAGLDPITSATIAELIVKTRDNLGVTSVVVSHDVPTIKRVANRIAMLHRGKIIAIGTVAEMENSDDPAVRQFMSGSTDGPIQITH